LMGGEVPYLAPLVRCGFLFYS